GLESSGEEDVSGDEGFEQGQDVPALPDAKKLSKELKVVSKKGAGAEPGVVYVGRIPHGFYEHEMKAYFSQFGDIRRLRLSRNRKTGQSKHYAFIEFASFEVAKIVADTMNNYLMFGHILKCKTVPKEQVHEKLWKGANKRFKKVPWSKLEGRKLEMGMGEAGWEKRIEGEKQRRKAKEEKLKAIGYEFDAPTLKGVAEVKARISTKAIEGPDSELREGGPKAIDQQPTTTIVVSEEVTTKKAKKNPKRKAERVEAEAKMEVTTKKVKKSEKVGKRKDEKAGKDEMLMTVVVREETKTKKPKRDRLRKADGVEEDKTTDARKPKKAKKTSV
ncbi:MAG: hypothetical protein M1830_000519, partial [Pleopsidium flavum]